MNLSSKKRIAARILGVGVSRVRFDPDNLDRIEDAITRDALRGLIGEGVIWVEPARGVSRGRHRERRRKLKKRGRGPGSKEGAAGARVGRKELWMKQARAMRTYLKMLKERGDIPRNTFNDLYRQVRGGQVRTMRRLKEIVELRSRA